jgi:hypothetical protein
MIVPTNVPEGKSVPFLTKLFWYVHTSLNDCI